MTLLDKISTLSDIDLANLFSNAVRLSETGTKRQQEEAAQLIPVLTEEAEGRAARARDELAARKAARPRTTRKTRAAAMAVPPDEAV